MSEDTAVVRLHTSKGETLAEIRLTDRDGTGYLSINDAVDGDGNVWIEIDGTDYGSLWFHAGEGDVRVELGQSDGDWWTPGRALYGPPTWGEDDDE